MDNECQRPWLLAAASVSLVASRHNSITRFTSSAGSLAGSAKYSQGDL